MEAVTDLEDEAQPRCTEGRLACPPEDVGGAGGYADVAAWVRAGRPRDDVPPAFESYEHAVRWLPTDWHPDTFDPEETNLRLQAMVASGELVERLRPDALGALLRLSGHGAATVAGWVAAAEYTSLSSTDLDELTEPYRRLLAVIGGGVELTASGYLRPPGRPRAVPGARHRPDPRGQGEPRKQRATSGHVQEGRAACRTAAHLARRTDAHRRRDPVR